MGLDQYAVTSAYDIETDKEFDLNNCEQIAQWRKHNRLEGWMRSLYYRSGGKGDFNMEPVKLSKEDIDELEHAVLNHLLPKTTGFFFGHDSYGDNDVPHHQDILFIEKARQAFDLGLNVYYYSWW